MVWQVCRIIELIRENTEDLSIPLYVSDIFISNFLTSQTNPYPGPERLSRLNKLWAGRGNKIELYFDHILRLCLLKISGKCMTYFVQERQKGRKKGDVWHPPWLFLFNTLTSLPPQPHCSIHLLFPHLPPCQVLGALSDTLRWLAECGWRHLGQVKDVPQDSIQWGMICMLPVLSAQIREKPLQGEPVLGGGGRGPLKQWDECTLKNWEYFNQCRQGRERDIP